jgi:hypothetical protein
MSETIEKNEKEIEKVTIERCNIFCRQGLPHISTTILPSEWLCQYHRFLQSIEMRKTSIKRPRLIIEVISKETIAVIVAIGDRYATKAILPDDLEYIVFRKHDYGFPIVYDRRTNKIYIINSIGDEAVIQNRLRYDFWLAVSYGEYYKVEKVKLVEETGVSIIKADKKDFQDLTTLMLVEKITGRKITQQ